MRQEEKILTREVSDEFMKNPYALKLGQFTSLADDAVPILALWPMLDLSGLTALSATAARTLAGKCLVVDLSGLAELPEATARGLASGAESLHTGKLILRGLTSLSETATQFMGEHHGALDLSGLNSLSDACAEALAPHRGDLDLSGLRSLSDAAAEALAPHTGQLFLGRVATLSDAAAHALSRHDYGVFLGGLTVLSDSPGHLALARKLAADGVDEDGVMALNGLQHLPDPVAKVLGRHRGTMALLGRSHHVVRCRSESLGGQRRPVALPEWAYRIVPRGRRRPRGAPRAIECERARCSVAREA